MVLLKGVGKMKSIKRLLVVLLCFSFVLTLFAGCKKGSEDSVSVVLSTSDVNFVDSEGQATYRIVRAEGNDSFTAVIPNIIKATKAKFGVAMKSISDEEEKTTNPKLLLVKPIVIQV